MDDKRLCIKTSHSVPGGVPQGGHKAGKWARRAVGHSWGRRLPFGQGPPTGEGVSHASIRGNHQCKGPGAETARGQHGWSAVSAGKKRGDEFRKADGRPLEPCVSHCKALLGYFTLRKTGSY